MPSDRLLVALGDCNTSGTEGNESFAYPYALGRALGVEVLNCGVGMFTTREGRRYAETHLSPRAEFVTIQYGLADSWRTFRGAPYVLYYPDNFVRPVLRKLVKRYKKIGRKLRFHSLFGQKYIVGPEEYRANVASMIQQARAQSPNVRICLISIPASLQEVRNPPTREYNVILRELAREYRCIYADSYALFSSKPEYFADLVHFTEAGHNALAELCFNAFKGH